MPYKAILTTLYLLASISISYTQHYDQIWYIGGNSESNPDFSGIILDFSDDSLDISSEFRITNYSQANASLCDSLGNMLLYTNGIHIANGLGEIMENGDSLNPGFFHDLDRERGYILEQGALALPLPESDSLALLIHLDKQHNSDFTEFFSGNLYHSLVDFTANSGLGRVEYKNAALQTLWMDTGKLTAVRHGNGRDWWIPVRHWGENLYDVFQLTPLGMESHSTQQIGIPIGSASLGQAVFSPDGSKYVHANLHGRLGTPIDVSIFDFDRCTGLLSNPVQFSYVDSAACLGAAISPNSRFLYLSSYKYVYQYDLHAADIAASRTTVAEWDGYNEDGFFSTTFYLAQLAPDGKIYINSNNSTRHLHVIEHPDSLGLACGVCQHCVPLPAWNSFSLPNFPNFRLGHEAGSPCDTLRQPPTAAWSHEAAGLALAFRSTSTHDIRRHRWHFGDGATDTLPHPLHTYTAEGLYEVCLTVQTPRGEDTRCQNLYVSATPTAEAAVNPGILEAWPNPMGEILRLRILQGNVNTSHTNLLLRDVHGRTVLQHPWPAAATETQINVAALPSGVYFYELRNASQVIATGRVVK